ncbi:MAG: energy transducer TonB [Gemmatimonadales bacterium]
MGRARFGSLVLVAACTAAHGRRLNAQRITDSLSGARAAHDSTAKCDSIVSAARVDSVAAALFISVRRSDGGVLGPKQAAELQSNIGAAFVAPRPFRLTVFAGPAVMPALRPIGDTASSLRAPTVTGMYRVSSNAEGVIARPAVIRAALAPGFEKAAVAAIEDLASLHMLFVPPDGADSMRLDVRFSSDSLPGALRFVSTSFPRMRVVDAVPLAGSPPPEFPADARADSLTQGEVVLRVVIDAEGAPVLDALEVVRATSSIFLRAALKSLIGQRFRPAAIRGCAVPQVIDYPFSFVLPEPPASRH